MFERLQKLLDDNKTNLHQLAVQTGIPYSCLADWKAGKSKPKVDKLSKISKFFNISIDYFL